MRVLTVLLSLGLSAPGLALADGGKLPHDLSWCQDRGEVEFELIAPKEMSDGVVESQDQLFNLAGFTTALFEDGKLYELRFRAYGDQGTFDTVSGAISKDLGAPTGKSAREWRGADGSQVKLRLQAGEMLNITWSGAANSCQSEASGKRAPTEAELHDREAMRDKPVVTFDPYADDPDVVEAQRKAKQKEAQKKEEEQKEEQDEKLDDTDIEW